MLNIIRHDQWCTNPGPKSSGRLNFVWWRLMCMWALSLEIASGHFSGEWSLAAACNFWEIYAPVWLYRTFEWYISADVMRHSVSGEGDSRSGTLETLHLIWNL